MSRRCILSSQVAFREAGHRTTHLLKVLLVISDRPHITSPAYCPKRAVPPGIGPSVWFQNGYNASVILCSTDRRDTRSSPQMRLAARQNPTVNPMFSEIRPCVERTPAGAATESVDACSRFELHSRSTSAPRVRVRHRARARSGQGARRPRRTKTRNGRARVTATRARSNLRGCATSGASSD